MIRILVTDDVDPEGIALLTAVPDFAVDVEPTLPPGVLLGRIGQYQALVGRSATRISAELLDAATNLRVIGRAGVGVDNVDLDRATELGIAVINAPAGNTIAVAELFFGSLLGLVRQIPQAATSMAEGRWDRSTLMGRELKGRRLGIVGVGRIGTEISRRAHAFGMDVFGFDPYIGDDRFTALRVHRAQRLEQLLDVADVLTIHTPLTDETRGMIGARELGLLKRGAIVANLARGGILDDQSLLDGLKSGHIAGAVLDVFEKEPLAADHPLRFAANVLLTPHMGASTYEAQRNVAVDVAEAVRDALLSGELSRSLNVASVSREEWLELQPSMVAAQRAAAVARAVLVDRGAREIRGIGLKCGPGVINGSDVLLAAAALGVLEGILESERLNLINARTLAEMRGLELSVRESDNLGHPDALEVRLDAGGQSLAVEAVALAGTPPRLTRIGEFHVDVPPRRILIVLTNNDVPGVIGRVGTVLGEARINIAAYHQSRVAQGGKALAAISVDDVVPEAVRQRLLTLPDVLSATVVAFREPV
ncbi:MAG TPA: phosphoglycerate dehydrogenase [Gemmatimonadaceae bacterium]|nr:phosphoglycerate dehydrogenase [Gemmatimonadaceae bacterium]